MEKEVEHGWALPIKIDLVHHVKDMGVIPLGVFEKISINEKGYVYTKRRFTHDCSFQDPSGLFVNNQVPRDSLHLCTNGF